MSEKPATLIADLTACDCLALFKSRELSPVEVVDDCLQRIDEANRELNAFCFVAFEQAKARARSSEFRWMRGEPVGLLDGVPVTLKDTELSRGMPTRWGSKATSGDGPWDIDAPAAARLREAGAVILGKTTTPEFGWKGVTDSPLFGITRNPWNPNLTPGGSSGGAAVAAALNLGFLHQAGDGGGSIRIPASFTGTFGFKPTFGYVPQWPLSAFTTLSHTGPITRTVADAALMMRVIAQKDVRSGNAGPEYPFSEVPLASTLRGLRVAYSRDFGYVDVSTDILDLTDAAAQKLESLGAEVIETNPSFDDYRKTFNTFWYAGAARLLNRLNKAQRGVLEAGFLEYAEQGLSLTLSDYQDAQEARFKLSAQMAAFHQKFDLLITPTMPVAPFEVGLNNPHGRQSFSPFTPTFNLTQQPAASLPCGLDRNGLPVGLQLVGARYNDLTVLSAARVLESALGRLVFPRIARGPIRN
ncbi:MULTISPECIES: amidase [unclassified Bradyrhizobium]|uniref:amidase n=1 Tax=unclassified Bradyrhizobium TaxID=2631580 RepID=UPI001FFB5A69|nr:MULTISPECIES: amidase [unclassified Bradyrhizobium]MCK1420019.1 amidase [Bradyrhizobium sp. CW12]MCK1647363.1 amidase [Bradyrhizobium sp. 154]